METFLMLLNELFIIKLLLMFLSSGQVLGGKVQKTCVILCPYENFLLNFPENDTLWYDNIICLYLFNCWLICIVQSRPTNLLYMWCSFIGGLTCIQGFWRLDKFTFICSIIIIHCMKHYCYVVVIRTEEGGRFIIQSDAVL